MDFKKLFLIDCMGAALTAICLAAVLLPLEAYFGMPRNILVLLSTIALVYALYSFCCFYFLSQNRRLFLKIISIANLLYCCLTISLVIVFYDRLTILGLVYFLLELLIMITLIFIEGRAVIAGDRGEARS